MRKSFSIINTYAIVIGCALAMLLFVGVRTAHAVGTNGSFEDGTAPGVFLTLTAGDTDITDWTIDSGGVDYIGTYWTAADGDRSLDLNSVVAGTVSQAFATVVGATYDISFALSGNPAGGPALKAVRVSATGATPQDYTYDTAVEANSLVDMKWATHAYSFVASDATTTLSFASLIGGAYGPALDNVVITETLPPPPPSGCSSSSISGSSITVNGVAISVSQSGCIVNNTSASASTGGNSATGSHGGRGGRGGDVEANAIGGSSNGNNGGSSAGNGGNGGSGGTGGSAVSGPATATATTQNILNRIRIRIF